MSEDLLGFLDTGLQQYLGPRLGRCPVMRRPALERLLTDDGQRRLHHARLAAADWGRSEGDARVAADCLLVTPRGLVYAAALRQPRAAAGPAAPPVPAPRQSDAPARSVAPARPVTLGQPADHPAALYYLATPPELFEPVAERLAAAQQPATGPAATGPATTGPATAAVDRRYGHDLEFTWPLDGHLQRTLDAQEALRLEQ